MDFYKNSFNFYNILQICTYEYKIFYNKLFFYKNTKICSKIVWLYIIIIYYLLHKLIKN